MMRLFLFHSSSVQSAQQLAATTNIVKTFIMEIRVLLLSTYFERDPATGWGLPELATG